MGTFPVLWEIIKSNPFHKAVLPKVKSKKQPFLSPEQIYQLLSYCNESWLKLCIELAFVCTLRKGELLALTWDDIDWDQNCIRINKTLCRVSRESMLELDERDVLHIFPTDKENSTVMVLKSPKTESSNRIVYLTSTVRQTLIDMKNKQKNTVYENSPRLIFAYNDGRPLQGAVLTKHFQKLLVFCGFSKVTFHSLRHSSITYKLIMTGGDIKAVQGDSGHAQADMIVELYERILDKSRKSGAERFGKRTVSILLGGGRSIQLSYADIY